MNPWGWRARIPDAPPNRRARPPCYHPHLHGSANIQVNGEAVEFYWTDTIPILWGGSRDKPTSITFRLRSTDFTGTRPALY